MSRKRVVYSAEFKAKRAIEMLEGVDFKCCKLRKS